MKLAGAGEQYGFGLGIGRVGHAAIYRAYCGAGFMIVKAHALGAFGRHNIENILRDCGAYGTAQLPLDTARIDRSIRAFRLAGAAIDAFAGDSR